MDDKTEALPVCLICGKRVPYRVEIQRKAITIKGVDINYDEAVAFCSVCGQEVYSAEVNDLNVRVRENVYKEKFENALNRKEEK